MSTVVLDTITGKSTATTITIGSTPVVSASANSMTIRGEGSAQTSIQQGLAKVWVNIVGAGTGFNDSFNASSVTDTGTGIADTTFTNNMANDDFSLTVGQRYNTSDGTGAFISMPGALTTSTHRFVHYENGSLADPVYYSGNVNGDLA